MQTSPNVFWFTGLPCAGKTTLATALATELRKAGRQVILLDGDELRPGLCRDLGFSENDRHENIRRAAEVAALLNRQGYFVCCSFVSPLEELRLLAREIIGPGVFVEVFVDTPVEICEARDVKGMYARARRGEIKQFTGVSAAYEEPSQAEIVLKAGSNSISSCMELMMKYVRLQND
ncbi:MAG: adenylyl-sulfate kinase [Bacteroidales bacterium]